MENNKLFCYGILKRGYALDLNNHGAKFLGEAHIQGATLYSIGGRGVGLRLNGVLSCGHLTSKHTFTDEHYSLCEDCEKAHLRKGYQEDTGVCHCERPVAHGELWEVPEELWQWLDDIEGNGFNYERKIVPVQVSRTARWTNGYIGYDVVKDTSQAWVYVHLFQGFKKEDEIQGGRF